MSHPDGYKAMVEETDGLKTMAILNRTQEERVLNWIKSNGEITSATAYNELGIIQLPKRIWNLKRRGYTIKTEWREGKNRYGEKVRFCAYSLG